MEEYLGVIKLFAGNFPPKGFAECNGQLLAIKYENALYALLGTTYGGDGKTNFALPKLDSPIKGARYIICIDGIFPTQY